MIDIAIEKAEKKYLSYILIVALLWAIVITQFKDFLVSLPVIMQFVLITFVSYALPGFVLGMLLNDGKVSVISRKAIGSMFFLSAWDLIIPPLIVNLDGQINGTHILFGNASIDAVIGNIWQMVGISGFLLFFFTYVVTFVLLQAVATWLLTKKQLWELLK